LRFDSTRWMHSWKVSEKGQEPCRSHKIVERERRSRGVRSVPARRLYFTTGKAPVRRVVTPAYRLGCIATIQ